MKNIKNVKFAVISVLTTAALCIAVYLIVTCPVSIPDIGNPPVPETGRSVDPAKILADNRTVADSVGQNGLTGVRPIDGTDHVLGDLSAPVQIIVYDNFIGPFSAEFAATLAETRDTFGEKVAIAYRHFPTRANALSTLAALAAECASEQDRFWEMHDKLYEAHRNNTLDAEILTGSAAGLDLDENRFKRCFEEAKYRDKISEQASEARNFSVTGAPTFFVNELIYIGAYPLDDFERSDGSEERGLRSIIESELGNP